MTQLSDEKQWSQQEFKQAQLGDKRRTKRLIRIAEQAATHPAGQITAVFTQAAQREAAFRFLENDAFDGDAVAQAAHSACAMRCAAFSYVVVPADGSSLNLPDGLGLKGFGPVGTHERGAQGLISWTAIGLSPCGLPLGVLGQRLWARQLVGDEEPKGQRAAEEKETQHIVDLMHDVHQVVVEHSPETVPWFQIDRAGDAWWILQMGIHLGVLLTSRASQDRRLVNPDGTPGRLLWETVQATAPIGGYVLQVPGNGQREARLATVVLRMCQVQLRLGERDRGEQQVHQLWAVQAKEVGSHPNEQERIEWMLLTNYPVETEQDALLVVRNYAWRWRIEQFHRLWKSECCNVEDTQLRSVEGVKKWTAVLASVAMRVQRIVYLSRQEAGLPATVEFTRAEIDATIVLRQPKGYSRGDEPTVAEVARWIADLGGYTGNSSGGPFGTKVLSRGLQYIAPVALVLSRGEL